MPSLSDAQQRELQTKANARLRRDFNARTFSVQNYRPPTGIGLFDFDYAPTARQSTVVALATTRLLRSTRANG